MRLGVSTMAFICLKLEQILGGNVSDLSDTDARSALKDKKEEVLGWLAESASFKLDPKNENLIISLAVEEEDAELLAASSSTPNPDCD